MIRLAIFWIFSILFSIEARAPDFSEGSPCTLSNNHSGICQLLSSCDSQMKSSGPPEVCGFEGFNLIVCCENGSSPDVNTTTNRPGRNESDSVNSSNTAEPDILSHRSSGERIVEACQEYSKIALPFIPDNILNGLEVQLTQYPHMAALGYPDQVGGLGHEFKCGGCLISDQWILTAAHCVPSRRPPTLIRMGVISLYEEETTPVDRTVIQSIRHPSYRADIKQNDIALIQLNQPVIFNDNVRPACIRTEIEDVPSAAELLMVKWRNIIEKRTERPGVLQQAVVPILPLTSCNDTFTKFNQVVNQPYLRGGLLDSQLCALDTNSSRASARATCVGDSGGPIFTYDDSGVSTLIGVFSFDVGCSTRLPSVHTRVASYIDWIEGIVWPK